MRLMRSSSTSAAPRPGWSARSASSSRPRATVSGVRSSCEASETNRRCDANACSSLARSRLKPSARRPTSSRGPGGPTRRDRSPVACTASTWRDIRNSGASVRRTAANARTAANTRPSAPAQPIQDSSARSVASTAARLAATTRVPIWRPSRVSGTVNARTSALFSSHQRDCVAVSRRSACGRSRRSSPPVLVSTSPPAVRTATSSSLPLACAASQRADSSASWSGLVTRWAGPLRNESALARSRSSRDRLRCWRAACAVSPTTMSSAAARTIAVVADSRTARGSEDRVRRIYRPSRRGWTRYRPRSRRASPCLPCRCRSAPVASAPGTTVTAGAGPGGAA